MKLNYYQQTEPTIPDNSKLRPHTESAILETGLANTDIGPSQPPDQNNNNNKHWVVLDKNRLSAFKWVWYDRAKNM